MPEQTPVGRPWSGDAAGLFTDPEPMSILQRILESARRAVNAAGAAVLRLREGIEPVLCVDAVDADEDATAALGAHVPLTDPAVGAAFTTGRPVVSRGVGEWIMSERGPGDSSFPPMTKDLDSTIAVPLVVAGERLGVLALARFTDATPFNEQDVRLVQGFADDAATVLGHAREERARRQLAVADERRRIARDLHDVVVQRLYVTGLQVRRLMGRTPDGEATSILTTIAGELDRAVRDIRTSIFALEQPGAAAGATIRGELWRRVREFSDVLGYEPWTSLDGPLDAAVPDIVLPDLYASVREALSNVARHAAATSVQVAVTVDPGGTELTLTVDDDGTGVRGPLVRRSGLSNLEARAAHWAGSLAVRRGPLGGARLEWRILLPRPGSPNAGSSPW